MTSVLTDQQRVELAIPARLVWDLAMAGCFSDPDAEVVERLKALLQAACSEPMADLPRKAKAKIARRIERAIVPVLKPWQGGSAVSLGMALYHFLEDLLSREVLVLLEGSSFAEAMAILLPMMEHGFEEEGRDATARDQARALLSGLQAAGYYRGA